MKNTFNVGDYRDTCIDVDYSLLNRRNVANDSLTKEDKEFIDMFTSLTDYNPNNYINKNWYPNIKISYICFTL
ncbi:hypothetical protein [Rickettsia endosymbiont of Polydrusus tereticollis]|uniref:hypothetical protein n=1 Tax=Rickettsia endosymbiont of Polydrusus tereticollis TaxID=3066251 RepID=UPI0031331BC4